MRLSSSACAPRWLLVVPDPSDRCDAAQTAPAPAAVCASRGSCRRAGGGTINRGRQVTRASAGGAPHCALLPTQVPTHCCPAAHTLLPTHCAACNRLGAAKVGAAALIVQQAAGRAARACRGGQRGVLSTAPRGSQSNTPCYPATLLTALLPC